MAEAVEEQVLALQRAADRRLQLAAKRRREAEQQRVRQVDDVEARLAAQPPEQLGDLLGLESALAAQHGDGHLAKALRIDLDLPLRRQPDHPGRVPQPIEDAWRMAEQRHLLLEEDADAAEEHLGAADVAFVGAGRRVDRRQQHVVAAGEQRRGERVVAQAAAAVHLAGAAGEREDSQSESPWERNTTNSEQLIMPPGTRAPGTESRRCSLREAAASSAESSARPRN